MEMGDLNQAEILFKKAVDWFDITDNKSYLVHYLTAFAEVLIRQKENNAALELLDKSISISKEISDYHELIRALYYKGISQFELGEYSESIKTCNIALPISIKFGDKYMEGALKELLGELDNDISLLREALNIFKNLNVKNKIKSITQKIEENS